MYIKNMYRYLLTFLFLLNYSEAFAYIDPGSGSLIISAIIGFIVTASTLIKIYYNKLKTFLKKKLRRNK